MALASNVGIVICYAGVGRVRDLFEEFIIFQHALETDRKYRKIRMNTRGELEKKKH
jgi:hypothetical protein